MKLWHYVLSLFGIMALFGATALLPHHVGPKDAYPDSTLSPGVIATSDIHTLTNYDSSCGTYSECHRNTSASLKKQIVAEYPGCNPPREIDHIVPLALGGADVAGNLWCQSGTGQWNFHLKDRLESYLVLQMKSGNISPSDAQQCILQDWVACFNRYMKPSFGAVDNYVADLDDEIDN